MKLICIRHGETNLNKQSLIQGSTDEPLNETGRMQAHDLGIRLLPIKDSIDAIYASPLVRAYETAMIATKTMGLSLVITTDENLKERDFMAYEKTPVKACVTDIYDHPHLAKPYETQDALSKRIFDTVDKLYQKHPHETIALFVHSHVIKTLLLKTDLADLDFRNLFIHQCEAFVLDIKKDGYTLINRISPSKE